jgi:hypothetical protein
MLAGRHQAHLGSQGRELETLPDDALERVDGEG